MFLICNGIVAFLARYSGFDSSSPGYGVNAWFLKRHGDGGGSASELSDMKPLVAAMVSQGQHALVVEEDPDQRQENEPFHLEGLGGENRALLLEDKEGEEETRSSIPKAADEEEEMKENEDPTSTEELNKKFEDFIRRIKEELRVEAQHQLITV